MNSLIRILKIRSNVWSLKRFGKSRLNVLRQIKMGKQFTLCIADLRSVYKSSHCQWQSRPNAFQRLVFEKFQEHSVVKKPRTSTSTGVAHFNVYG